MAKLASGFMLAENEKLIMEIEAELWATSSNPIALFLGEIKRVISMILGFRQKGFLIITDRRVVEVATRISCWAIITSRDVKYIPAGGVNEVGYTRRSTCCFFCPAYHLYYRTTALLGLKNNVLLKGVDEAGALKAANAFYAAIDREDGHNTRETAANIKNSPPVDSQQHTETANGERNVPVRSPQRPGPANGGNSAPAGGSQRPGPASRGNSAPAISPQRPGLPAGPKGRTL